MTEMAWNTLIRKNLHCRPYQGIDHAQASDQSARESRVMHCFGLSNIWTRSLACLMKTQPLKGLGGGIRGIASLYLSEVPFVIYVCISGRLAPRIALKSQRARASL